jgi:predicted DNA-binding transcriptional regulator AlpA
VAEIKQIIDEQQMCDILGISPKTAQSWRLSGDGPSWYKLGKRLVRYRTEDVVSFFEAGLVQPPRRDK